MIPEHEVHIKIRLRLRKYSVRERLLRWLFGDAREILVLKPGETVDKIAVEEVEEE